MTTRRRAAIVAFSLFSVRRDAVTAPEADPQVVLRIGVTTQRRYTEKLECLRRSGLIVGVLENQSAKQDHRGRIALRGGLAEPALGLDHGALYAYAASVEITDDALRSRVSALRAAQP